MIFRAFRHPPLHITAVYDQAAVRSFRRLSMLPEGYVHAALSLSHMASQRLTCSRAPRREVSNRLNGRPDLARSGPEIGLQIATVRAAATVEGSAARPGHPAAGTRHRRPYLRAMWADSAPASGVAFAAAAWWSRHRTSRTPFTLVLLGVACRCGKKAQHVSKHHQAAGRAAGECSVPVLVCLNASRLWLTFPLSLLANSNSIRPFCASTALEKLIGADNGLKSRADQIEKVRLCVWYTPHKPHSEELRLRVARVCRVTHTRPVRSSSVSSSVSKYEPGAFGALSG